MNHGLLGMKRKLYHCAMLQSTTNRLHEMVTTKPICAATKCLAGIEQPRNCLAKRCSNNCFQATLYNSQQVAAAAAAAAAAGSKDNN